ncbi:MAG: hypothetical protein JKY26_01630 [Pseudomonas sp.]|nr:hypothetical protein [Pseudomonas sp.]
MIKTITTRVKALKDAQGKPLFASVKSAVDMVSEMQKPLNVATIAFIVPLEETPSVNHREMGPALQNITQTFGVLIGLRIGGRNEDDSDKLEVLRTALRNSLFGWQLNGEYTPCLLATSNLQQLQERQLFWMDRFTTEHLEEASQ